MPVDGVAAAQTLLSYRDIKGGMCLFYVWTAYKTHGARADGSYGTALEGWYGSPGKHAGDWNPPAGVPVWFGAKSSSSAGDVVISLGGGRVACTDYPVYGVVGSCTIAERQRQIARPYLGWTETILGAPIAFAGAPAPAEAPPVLIPAPPLEQDDMEMIRIGGQHLAAIGVGVFRHFVAADPYEKIKNIARIQDDWQEVSFAELPALLKTYGCDLNIWDIRDGGFVVFDPIDGSVRSGNAWTATGAVRAAIAGLSFPTPDPTPIVTAVRDAIASSGVKVDETAIANAVREKFRTDPVK
ncbi:hypothetical protein [uncultured Microbacterium sp.]|uniref:hypothetical protein n=1 Tax=uncultured Microbacterium sp. TaxID=191216 RepID=UPI0025DC853D|nr:hypothetical protein [uncultured Microbacterium sp.]